MPAGPASSSVRRPGRSSAPACEPGSIPPTCAVASLGEPLSTESAEQVRRGEAALAAISVDGDTSGDGDVDKAEETAFGAITRRLRIASPERVRRALREPWRVTPGSLVSAMMPPGRRTTIHLRVPYDAMIGSAWPDAGLWIVAVDLDVGSRVVFGRRGAPEVSVGAAVEASCAIPGYFAPVTIDGARYVDGAVHSTTNADLVAELDPPPDLVIVSRTDVGGLGRRAAGADPLVASARAPPGRRRGRRAAGQGARHGDVAADGRRPRRDDRRLDGSGEGVECLREGRRVDARTTFASRTSPSGSTVLRR